MSTETEEVTRCDRCGRSPNGDSPDSTWHYRCGHDVCNECMHFIGKRHPEAKHPMAWCPKCEKVVATGYAP